MGKELRSASRDYQIIRRIRKGDRYEDIASDFGLSIGRISQINSSFRGQLDDDGRREIMMAQLEGYLDVLHEEIIHAPDSVKVTPSGKVVYENLVDENGEMAVTKTGQPVPDLSRPVYDKTPKMEAIKVATGLSSQLARLGALDKVRKKENDADEAVAEAMAWQETVGKQFLAMRAENERLKVMLTEKEPHMVEAEIVEDHSS